MQAGKSCSIMEIRRSYKFQFTGVSSQSRENLTNRIRTLGGQMVDDGTYKSCATHLICAKPTRSEKFLGFLSTGKWILIPSYINHSYKAKKWLKEDDYEWSPSTIQKPEFKEIIASSGILSAPQRWREKLGHGQQEAFQGWTVGLLVDNHKRKQAYKRILEVGGASVVNLTLPITSVSLQTQQLLKYVFCDNHQRDSAAATKLSQNGIMCLNAEFIGDYLIKDTLPDVKAFLIMPVKQSKQTASSVEMNLMKRKHTLIEPQGYAIDNKYVSVKLHKCSLTHSHSIAGNQSDLDNETTMGKSKKTRPNMDSGMPDNGGPSKNMCSTPQEQERSFIDREISFDMKSQISIGKNMPISTCPVFEEHLDEDDEVKHRTNGKSLKSKSMNSETQASSQESALTKKISSIEDSQDYSPLTCARRIRVTAQPEEKPGVIETPSEPSKSNLSVKKKLWREDSLEDSWSDKKQKINYLPNVSQWVPSTCTTAHTEIPTGTVRSLTQTNTAMIHTYFEEDQDSVGINQLLSAINSDSYPQPKTLYIVMVNVLKESKDPYICNEAYMALKTILSYHPPTLGTMQDVYMQSLQDDGKAAENPGKSWDFLSSVIIDAITEATDGLGHGNGHRKVHKHGLLLTYLVTVLESNFYFYQQRYNDTKCRTSLGYPMIAKIMWPHHNWNSVSSACREIFTALMSTFIDEPTEEMEDVRDEIVALIAMAAEFLFLFDNISNATSSRYDLFYRKSMHFAQVLSSTIRANIFDKNDIFWSLIKSVKPPWLQMKVCESILESFDDSLLTSEKVVSGQRLSLEKIVSSFFYMLPSCNENALLSPHKKNQLNPIQKPTPRRSSRPTQLFPSPRTPSKSPMSVTSSMSSGKKSGPKINRQNGKGETQLHIACIKNNVAKVTELLQVSAIDINVKDYAGWTPLHEACNHGHKDCVMALLNFKSRNILRYFEKGQSKEKVDLLACSDDGLTPLHDAVQNNHIEVAKLLLQHGGAKLLEAKTPDSQQPIHLSISEEMKEMLNNFKNGAVSHMPVSKRSLYVSSQGSQLSDESQVPSDLSVFDHLPTDDTYHSHGFDGTGAKYANVVNCDNFVTLLLCLLNTYMEVHHIEQSHIASVENEPASNDLHKSDAAVLRNLKLHIRGLESHLSKIVQGGHLGSLHQKLGLMKIYSEGH